MTEFKKIVVLFVALCTLVLSTASVNAAGVTISVVCKVEGHFILPEGHGETIVKFIHRYDYVKAPPSLGSAQVDNNEQLLHDQCYKKARWSNEGKIVMFPYTVQRGVLTQKVIVVACFKNGGGFVHQGKYTPAKTFRVNLTMNDKKPANDPVVKRFC